MRICPHCNIEFNGNSQSFGAHIRNCKQNPNIDKYNKAAADAIKKTLGVPRNKHTLICPRCNKRYNIVVTDSQFKRGDYNKYCSIECSHKKLEIKFCNNCGEKLKKIKGNLCKNCFLLNKYDDYIFLWKQNKIDGMTGKYGISKNIKKYFMEKYSNKCCLCGWNKVNKKTGKIPLTIHHIDGNYKNNQEDNLQLLCPNCHSLTETYCSLNIGNGRKK